MTTSESKGRFFLQNESIRITNRIDSNRELECSSRGSVLLWRRFDYVMYTPGFMDDVFAHNGQE